MRIGLVRYINSRPLDYGFRKNPSVHTHNDTPANLYKLLKSGKLDAALISSVECLRNEDIFSFCKTAGVCAASEVNSIFYLTRDTERLPDFFLSDQGSRTSVALLQILLYKKFGKIVPHQKSDPEKIPALITETTGGLVIGDKAYQYHKENQNDSLIHVDLGRWWNEEEGLPFVFALWAYPKNKIIPDSFFEESLEIGLQHIEEIIAEADDPSLKEYLTESLHYKLKEPELKSLDRFKSLLQELDLL
ncbi:MAG: menaquinone biosynthesis protein [Spirochaetia bacterium]|nr:menaquinone biosynthesis protein [Spirochaetia bacterium]